MRISSLASPGSEARTSPGQRPHWTSGNTLALIQPEDRDFFDRELASFLPDRVFDAHAHVWAHRNMHPSRRIASPAQGREF